MMETAVEPAGFGALLRHCRLAAELTQEALAEQAGLSVRSIQDLERGVAHPRVDTTERLLAALGLRGEARIRFLALARPAPRRPRLHLIEQHPTNGVVPERATARNRVGLPAALTSFVGRERELAEVQRLLASSRLVTLTGAGGVGKTRLAQAVAARLSGTYSDGAQWVELAPLADPALVPQTVAAALDVDEQPGQSLLPTLLAALQPRCLLLVLDNCEHVVEACAQVADALLRGCPGITVLATSREALGIAGEVAWHVPSLAVPTPGPRPPLAEVAASEAGRLFLARAVAARPSFTLSEKNAAAVAQLCQRLDGIPLALELAAARLPVLSVEQIATRLDDCFRLLTAGSRTALPRQQTLRATLDWSYDLLTEAEQILFRRLAVFASGWTLEAAEAVCAGDGVETGDVLELLARLTAKSLVQAEEEGGAVRYRLLETVRQYGWERLEGSGEAGALRGRHAAYYGALAETAAPGLEVAGSSLWLEQLDREHDNLRAALDWVTEGGAIEAGLRLGAALASFWGQRGYLAEGRDRVARLLARPGPPSPARAAALLSLGRLAWAQGDYPAQRRYDEESLALARRLKDPAILAHALSELGAAAFQQGRYDEARAHLDESLALYQQVGDQQGLALSLMRLASVARDQGDYAAAAPLYEEALRFRRSWGDRSGVAHILSNLGWMALYRGDYAAARALQEESLAIREALGERREIAVSLTALARVDSAEGDQRAARARYLASLPLHWEVGNQWGLALALEGLAAVAVEPGRAARLAAAGATLRAAIGRPLPLVEQAAYDRLRDGLRQRLGDRAFAAAWTAGERLCPDEAMAEAVALATEVPASGDALNSRASALPERESSSPPA